MIRLAINGFGRIGRTVVRKLYKHPDIELVAINDLTDTKTLAHLLKYDSVHRLFNGEIKAEEHAISINGKSIPVFAEKDPSQLPWKALNIDVVLESTGHFTAPEKASLHLTAGAKRVVISAPAKGDVSTIVLGVNDHLIKGDETILSNASCTTNNAAPMIEILDKAYGIEAAYISTIHAYTGDQNLHDAPHKDLRRARAAANSIIPTTTGAAKAISDVFPHLNGKIGGAGIRVPVIDGSMTDITCIVTKKASVDEINKLFHDAAHGFLKGILEYTEDPIVSNDIIGNDHSCVFDAQLTSVLNEGHMVKIVGWYDNESGYSKRLAELIERISKKK
ncbi:MAG: type I glyceraldehyde-3-phosphate dehydrogenase [Bacteroidetes bacterium]|nr:type I glyceraldehyde-3-phosphate dehydrogenase [Bacteroidota bacterium]